MKIAVTFLFASIAMAFIGVGLRADDKKEVTLKGTILCAKCALKEKGVTKCTTAIQVKEGEKTVTYYFDDKGTKEEYHEPVCGGERKTGSVVGVVHKHDDKMMIKPSKVEYDPK